MTDKQNPKPDELKKAAAAKQAMTPELNAAGIMQALNVTGEPDLAELIGELAEQRKAVSRGDITGMERMLVSQAHALDSVFAHLSRRAASNMGQYMDAAETYMKLALRAQSQCRATLETLATIKNPPNVAFVKQANIAHGPQQVNNGHAVAHTEQNANPPTELLEPPHAKPEWVDAGTTRTAVNGNPPLEAVGAIHRPTNAGRKSRIKP